MSSQRRRKQKPFRRKPTSRLDSDRQRSVALLLLVVCLPSLSSTHPGKRRKLHFQKQLSWDAAAETSTEQARATRSLASFRANLFQEKNDQSTVSNTRVLSALTEEQVTDKSIDLEKQAYYLDQFDGGNGETQQPSTVGTNINTMDGTFGDANFSAYFWDQLPSSAPLSDNLTYLQTVQPSDFPTPFSSLSLAVSEETPSLTPLNLAKDPSDEPSLESANFPSVSNEDSFLASLSPSEDPSDELLHESTKSMTPSYFASLETPLEPWASMMPSESGSSSVSSEVTATSETPANVVTDPPSTINATLRDEAGPNTVVISSGPSASRTKHPTSPSAVPSDMPSSVPSFSAIPSQAPTISSHPTWSASPSDLPSDMPSDLPSTFPSLSANPSGPPSWLPSFQPSDSPSTVPSNQPSFTSMPSDSPSIVPTFSPSATPSSIPSMFPSDEPSLIPSRSPTMTPSALPSGLPSSSPTLICHDEPAYISPINGFDCADHKNTSCIQWKYLGLTLDDLEELIVNCPVSCEIDCGTLNRFNITISYQISKVPGLLDAATVDVLNTLTRDYLSAFIRIREPLVQFYIDHVELLSQTIIPQGTLASLADNHEKTNNRWRSLLEKDTYSVILWVTVAVRGFAFSLPLENTTDGLIAGVDSRGYSNSIQNSGNVYLKEAHAFSAAANSTDSASPILEEVPETESGSVAAIVVTIVVCICLGACCASAYFYRKRSTKWLPGCRKRRRQVVPRMTRSPESHNVASAMMGSMFSFDDTATAGTNGLMRFISFSESDDSTSSGSSARHSIPQDGVKVDIPDEELGLPSPKLYVVAEEEEGEAEAETETPEDADESTEEDEPHPLTGIIPSMIVYDFIDEEELGKPKVKQPKQRSPSVVPARRVEASSRFIAALGNRRRPSASHDLADLFISEANFLADPFTGPVTNLRLESRRPSPISLLMDGDDQGDFDDDEISVASTPIRMGGYDSETHPVTRRTKSLDSINMLDSHSDTIASDYRDDFNKSPNVPPTVGKTILSLSGQTQGKEKLIAVIPVIKKNSPTKNSVSPDSGSKDPDARGHAEAISQREYSPYSVGLISRHLGGIQEPRSFWNRSPIAKGVKEAIWSTRRSGTPTKARAPATPTRNDNIARQSVVGASLMMPGLADSPLPSVSNRQDGPAEMRGSPHHPQHFTPPGGSDLARRHSSMPTTLEMVGKQGTSPDRLLTKSNSEEFQGESSHSASFSTAQESIEEEAYYEFRAQRIGKLGLVINCSPKTGPVVEKVKDYSTLFGRIHAGDIIVEVDGVETANMSIKDVTKRLAGRYGMRSVAGEVRIKVARIRERELADTDDQGSDHSKGSGAGSVDSFHSYHRRYRSEPEPLLDRIPLNSMSGDKQSPRSYGHQSKFGEEI